MKITISKVDTEKTNYYFDTIWTMPDGFTFTLDGGDGGDIIWLFEEQPVVSSETVECKSFEELIKAVPYPDALEEVYMNVGQRQLEFMANNSDVDTLFRVYKGVHGWSSPVVDVCAKRLCYLLDMQYGAYQDYVELEWAFERVMQKKPKWFSLDGGVNYAVPGEWYDLDVINEMWNSIVSAMDKATMEKLPDCDSMKGEDRIKYIKDYLKIAPNDLIVDERVY